MARDMSETVSVRARFHLQNNLLYEVIRKKNIVEKTKQYVQMKTNENKFTNIRRMENYIISLLRSVCAVLKPRVKIDRI